MFEYIYYSLDKERKRGRMAWRSLYLEVLPFTTMVAAECTNVGLNILFKAASLKGMSYYVFIPYSYAFATLLLLPTPFIFCRKNGLPSFNFSILSRLSVLAVIGFIAQMVGYKGIEYSSPTLSSAISNLTPAITFILAVIFRMEKLPFKRLSTQAKIIGTITSISGALIVLLYKGPTIWSTRSSTPKISLHWPLASQQSDWVVGGLLLATQYLLNSFWYILQAQIMRLCPMELLVTFCYTLGVTIVSAPVCFVAERNLDSWKLRSDIGLVAIVYSGIFGPCFNTIAHSWGLRLKGPLYIAMFRPLSIAIAVLMGAMFLGDALYLGCIIGAVVISMGFYAVVWGKAIEERSSDDHSTGSSLNHLSIKTTLLLETTSEGV